MIVARSKPFPPDVHFIGVGGSGTSGLAQILRSRGIRVTGSDRTRESLGPLLEAGISVELGHRPENLGLPVRLVVHSAAIPETNPELRESRRRGLQVLKYAQCLGKLLDGHHGIAISGTHGKTSTGAMLTSVWLEAGRDPTVLLGGHCSVLGGNWRDGAGGDFIVEACEYDRSFLHLRPRAAIVTNLELDHPDVYSDLGEVQESFRQFLANIPEDGPIIVGADDPSTLSFHTALGRRVTTYGFEDGVEWQAQVRDLGERSRFLVVREGRPWREFELGVAGVHNIANALGVIALADHFGVDIGAVESGLAEFRGVDRRFQHRGRRDGVDWVDDFAHHPTEIQAAIETARVVYRGRPIRIAFQPHQYGRLQSFGPAFAAELARADSVALLPVYSVREKVGPESGALLDRFAEELRRLGTPVECFEDFDDAERRLLPMLHPDEVVVACGAGDLHLFTDRILRGVAEPRG